MIIGILAASCESKNANGPDSVTAAQVAQCLTAKGAVLYGASWCPATQMQIAEFGEAFAHINYVECTVSAAACDNAGISAYPTWIMGGVHVEGYCELSELAAWAGCNN
jgi:hypothetical protein